MKVPACFSFFLSLWAICFTPKKSYNLKEDKDRKVNHHGKSVEEAGINYEGKRNIKDFTKVIEVKYLGSVKEKVQHQAIG
jgi:hypothetical protein